MVLLQGYKLIVASFEWVVKFYQSTTYQMSSGKLCTIG